MWLVTNSISAIPQDVLQSLDKFKIRVCNQEVNLHSTLRHFNAVGIRLYNNLCTFLTKFGIDDVPNFDLKNHNFNEEVGNMNLVTLLDDWKAHITNVSTACYDLSLLYEHYMRLNKLIPANVNTQISSPVIERMSKGDATVAWPLDCSLPFQRLPRYEMMAKALVDELNSANKNSNISATDLQQHSPEYQVLNAFWNHTKIYALECNIVLGRVAYAFENPTENCVFLNLGADDVVKQKSRNIIVTSTSIREERDESNIFASKTRLHIDHKDVVMVLRSTTENDCEIGTIILSAPILDSNAPNIFVREVVALVKDQEPTQWNDSFEKLLTAPYEQPTVYKYTKAQEPTPTYFFQNQTPIITDKLSQPRNVFIIRANLSKLPLVVPTQETSSKSSGRRRSSLGSDQRKDFSNVIQLFSYNTPDLTSKPDAQIAVHFALRTSFVSMCLQLMCNTEPASITLANVPQTRHKRRLSFFSSEKDSSTTNVATPSSSTTTQAFSPTNETSKIEVQSQSSPSHAASVSITSSNTPATVFAKTDAPALTLNNNNDSQPAQQRPTNRVPTPLAMVMAQGKMTPNGTNPANAFANARGPKKRPSETGQPTAHKRRSKEFTATDDNQQVSLNGDAASTTQNKPLQRATLGKINVSQQAAAQQIATPGAGAFPRKATLKSGGLRTQTFKQHQLKAAVEAGEGAVAEATGDAECADMGQGDCQQQ